MIEQKKLNKLKKQLKGKLSTVARELKVPPSTVSRVLNGVWENELVIQKCIEVRDRIKNKIQELENQI